MTKQNFLENLASLGVVGGISQIVVAIENRLSTSNIAVPWLVSSLKKLTQQDGLFIDLAEREETPDVLLTIVDVENFNDDHCHLDVTMTDVSGKEKLAGICYKDSDSLDVKISNSESLINVINRFTQPLRSVGMLKFLKEQLQKIQEQTTTFDFVRQPAAHENASALFEATEKKITSLLESTHETSFSRRKEISDPTNLIFSMSITDTHVQITIESTQKKRSYSSEKMSVMVVVGSLGQGSEMIDISSLFGGNKGKEVDMLLDKYFGSSEVQQTTTFSHEELLPEDTQNPISQSDNGESSKTQALVLVDKDPFVEIVLTALDKARVLQLLHSNIDLKSQAGVIVIEPTQQEDSNSVIPVALKFGNTTGMSALGIKTFEDLKSSLDAFLSDHVSYTIVDEKGEASLDFSLLQYEGEFSEHEAIEFLISGSGESSDFEALKGALEITRNMPKASIFFDQELRPIINNLPKQLAELNSIVSMFYDEGLSLTRVENAEATTEVSDDKAEVKTEAAVAS